MEALGQRVTIFTGGKLLVYGSVPRLRYRFGDGFVVHLKLKPLAKKDSVYILKATLTEIFEVPIQNDGPISLTFTIKDPKAATWFGLFYRLNRITHKSAGLIKEYIITEKTLQSIYFEKIHEFEAKVIEKQRKEKRRRRGKKYGKGIEDGSIVSQEQEEGLEVVAEAVEDVGGRGKKRKAKKVKKKKKGDIGDVTQVLGSKRASDI